MGTTLFIIDPQHDFIDPKGALSVPGGHDDMASLADLIYGHGDKINKVVIVLDQHQYHHIAHPMMWVDKKGRHPKPFTVLTQSDVTGGKWRAAREELEVTQAEYVRDVEAAGGSLTIWPPHCIVGTWGATMCELLQYDIGKWANPHRPVHIFTKSHNWSTEQYSGFQAIVPRENDSTTHFNKDLWHAIQDDQILIGGEALSHCVKETVLDAINWVPETNLASRMVILSDCTSPVAGFNMQAEQFLHDFSLRGGRFIKSGDVFRNDDTC